MDNFNSDQAYREYIRKHPYMKGLSKGTVITLIKKEKQKAAAEETQNNKNQSEQ